MIHSNEWVYATLAYDIRIDFPIWIHSLYLCGAEHAILVFWANMRQHEMARSGLVPRTKPADITGGRYMEPRPELTTCIELRGGHLE